MKLYTYSGETPQEALGKARNAHGDEALVVETREIRKRTASEAGLFEAVIAVNESAELPTNNQTNDSNTSTNSIQQRLDDIAKRELERKRAQKNNAIFDENISKQLSRAVKEISELSNQIENDDVIVDFSQKPKKPSTAVIPQNNAKPMISKTSSTIETLNKRIDSKIQEKQGNADELRGIKQELNKLNDKLRLIQNMVWEDRGPKQDINIPHEFAEIYRIAKNSGMMPQHLDAIMSLSLELMPLKMRESSVTIKRYFREVLRKMIYCRPESKDNSKKIMMLVGPTGVGKTTALAKLAARFSLEKRLKVGIITLDSYRIGALEQLEWYAERMRISIQLVMAPEDFLKALDSLRHCDYILVDTAGRSQNDSERISQIRKFLQSDYKINTSLVMSANTKFDDLRDIYNAFNILDIDTLIFSKLDESRGLGNIFSLAYETKKPISYFSVGQEVPTDLLVATNDLLVDWLLDGFTNPFK